MNRLKILGSIGALLIAGVAFAAGGPLDRLEFSLRNDMQFSQMLTSKPDCKHFVEWGSWSFRESYCDVCARVLGQTDWKVDVRAGTPVILEGFPSKDVEFTTAAASVVGFDSDTGKKISVNLTVNCGGAAVSDSKRLRKILTAPFAALNTGKGKAASSEKSTHGN
jgi:hypothetical protein